MIKLKQFLWFIFKSPQRKMVNWSTVFTDLTGYFELKKHQRTKKKLQPITVCTGLYNRSENYLNIVLEAINKSENIDLITLSVFDCASDDIPNLEEKIKQKWQGSLVFDSNKTKFSRSYAFNKAIKNATTELVLILDADISLPAQFVQQINNNITENVAWFPILNWIQEDGKSRQFTEGTGIFSASKTQLNKIGFYNEKYMVWGHEDWDLFFRFYKNGIKPNRSFEPNWVHHFHQRNIPKDFEKMF